MKLPKGWDIYPIDKNVAIIRKKMSALEKLKATPIGRRIKVSDCDDVEVKYVIWRTGENAYKIECKKELDITGVLEVIWNYIQLDEGKEPEEIEHIPDDFEPTCYRYETIEGLTAQELLDLEPILMPMDKPQMVHNIECHELYEIPTETEIAKEQYKLDWSKCKVVKTAEEILKKK